MIPINYDLAKERMADRLREAEQRRLVLQAKAASREGRKADAAKQVGHGSLTSWLRPFRKVSQAPSTSSSRSAI